MLFDDFALFERHSNRLRDDWTTILVVSTILSVNQFDSSTIQPLLVVPFDSWISRLFEYYGHLKTRRILQYHSTIRKFHHPAIRRFHHSIIVPFDDLITRRAFDVSELQQLDYSTIRRFNICITRRSNYSAPRYNSTIRIFNHWSIPTLYHSAFRLSDDSEIPPLYLPTIRLFDYSTTRR